LEQVAGGHRRREYCDENCRQTAFRLRREQQHKDVVARRWQAFTPGTQQFLDWLAQKYGETVAASVEIVLRHEVALARETGNEQELEDARQGLAEVQERFRAYVATTNKRLEDLTSELAARRQEQECGPGNRDTLQLELAALGERLHWRLLIIGQTTIKAGEESWRLYIAQAEDALLSTAIGAARFYQENLQSLGMLS